MPKKSPQPEIRRLHMTESTAGHFVPPPEQSEGYRKTAERRVKRRTSPKALTAPEHVQGTTHLLEKEIREGQHPLAVDALTRLELREWWKEGASVTQLAKQYGLSITLVKRVIEMKEKLLSKHEREELLARKFLESAQLVTRILGAVTDEKLEHASFSQLALGMGISMDKMLLIRKSLDGEAATQVEMALNVTHDREELRERIRTLLDQNPRLRSLVQAEEVPVEVIEEKPVVRDPKVLPNQLPLFQDQETR